MPGPSLRGILSPPHVDPVDEEVDKGRRKCQGQVVASRFDEHNVGVGEFGFHLFHRGYVHRRVLAHGCVGACAGFDSDDSVLDKHAFEHTAHVLGIFGGHDVVGYDEHLESFFDQVRCDCFDKCGFS